jgi:sugar phosphate isomerase/epimerase
LRGQERAETIDARSLIASNVGKHVVANSSGWEGGTKMTSSERPQVGISLNVERLRHYQDWILGVQRPVEFQDAANSGLLDNGWKSVAGEINQLLDGHTGYRGIHGPFIDLTIGASDLKIRHAVIERLKQGLEFGAEIGATHMVIHSPIRFLGSNPFEPPRNVLGLTDEFGSVQATVNAILPRAQEIGCTIVIENLYDRNPSRLCSMVESFDSEYVRLSIDVGHAYVASKLGGATPDHWVRHAGSLLAHLHLQDTDGDADRHWPPGFGSVQWHALFNALGEIEAEPRLIIETFEDPVPGVNWLNEKGYVR